MFDKIKEWFNNPELGPRQEIVFTRTKSTFNKVCPMCESKNYISELSCNLSYIHITCISCGHKRKERLSFTEIPSKPREITINRIV